MSAVWHPGDKVAVSERSAWWAATVVKVDADGLEIRWDDRYAWWHAATERVPHSRVSARDAVRIKRPARRALIVATVIAVLGLGAVAVVVQPWAERGTYVVGQPVEIKWQSAWHAGSILEVNGGRYLVHYDGYDDSWNEVVGPARLRSR